MISVDEARGRVLEALRPLPAEQVSLAEAAGRTLAEDIRARVTKPPVAVSAMDGYAVKAGDTARLPAVLKVVGEAPAGGAHDQVLQDGEAVRIFTGAPVPEGADAVVIQENTRRDGDRVTVEAGVSPGLHVRVKGLDFAEGDPGGLAGRRLGPREIGLAATMNVPWLKVTRPPQVAILGTGDELVMPGETPGPNQIVSSNSLVLAAMVREAGGVPVSLGIVADDEASLRAAARDAGTCDLLVVTGGMSVGEHDLVRKVLAEEGLELDFWKVAMRPGKPLAFGMLGTTAMLGFPGNPVSTLICGHLFLRPAIFRLLGREDDDTVAETAILATDLAANDERQDYLRATLERSGSGELVTRPFERQDSSMMATLSKAACLILREAHASPHPAGQRVSIIRL